MSARTEVLLWAQRVTARATSAPAHVVLELGIDASIDDAQEAFHKIARSSHPDLHRASLTPGELELVTSAYARCAGAYQEFRAKRLATRRMRALADDRDPVESPDAPAMTPPARAPSEPGLAASGPMNSKAQLYYRKAEMALRRGDLKAAVLNIKMAIAGDPGSAVLRTALAEIESELAKK